MPRSSFLRIIVSLSILALGINGDQNYTVTLGAAPAVPPYLVGSTLMLNCTVNPQPSGTVTYAWECSGCFAEILSSQAISRVLVEMDDNSMINCIATIDGENCTSVMPFVLQVTVPAPSVAVTAFNNQMVNQAVSLQCAVTAVRGIMSRVDILWSSGGTELQRVDGVPRGMSDSAQVIYTNSYDTLPLNTTDDGRMIQCQVVINTTPPVIANGSITLDVTVPNPMVTVSPIAPIQGAMVGSPQVINCTVSTVDGVQFSSVMISWMGPRGAITTNGRVTVGSVNNDGSNNYSSSLQFDYLSEGDEGNYTCNVMILDASSSQSVELQSLSVPTPVISTSPVAPIQRAMVGSSQVINCTVSTVDGVESNSVMIGWIGPRGAITTNGRVTVGSVNNDGSNNYSSSLQFDYLSEGDEGNYTCNVMISGTSASASVELQPPLNIPTPSLTVTALNNRTVGQSLTLQCAATTVRGITSRVDIVWRNGSSQLQMMNNVSSTMMSNSLVYRDSYTIPQLSTTDDDRVIQCQVVINTTPPVTASGNITLNVTETTSPVMTSTITSSVMTTLSSTPTTTTEMAPTNSSPSEDDDSNVGPIIGIALAIIVGVLLLILVILIIIVVIRNRNNRQGFYKTNEGQGGEEMILKYSASLRSITRGGGSAGTENGGTINKVTKKEQEYYI